MSQKKHQEKSARDLPSLKSDTVGGISGSSFPRVTEILKVAGISDFSRVPIDVLEASQYFGIAVHLATELDDLGTLDMSKLSTPLLPYLEAWRKFRRDYNLKFARNEIEVSLVSHKWRFRGTLDRISKKQNILIDIKSGMTLSPATAIQTAAYAVLAEENGVKIKKRFCVQLAEKGYAVTPYTDISDRTVFISALNLFNFKKRKG